MMKPTGEGPRFKSKDEILAECATVGISQNTPVYLYCFKGARASNTFLALKNAGVKDVRMYLAPGTNGRAIHRCRSTKACRRAARVPTKRHKTCMIITVRPRQIGRAVNDFSGTRRSGASAAPV